ncbi:preprotein translocase subunit SecY [Candidatus Pacearchaeota archaeon CG10_big_fil_rev_8_21_14_0_10_30_48]|nr:MAG: preprotein translocase subunit SecY [Candidatus Pacearchaeota archaeon CG10_big_fil_rev_8_21_14_0_10_30_48]
MAMNLVELMKHLPEVEGPKEKLGFGDKAKWTIFILVAFFILSNISLYGMASSFLARFDQLAVLLGTDFGSVISLGIGPIVTASIILQLLVGSQILNIDTHSAEGKKYFQGLQKLLVLGFIVFESIVFVVMGGFSPDSSLGSWGAPIIIFQLMIGGFAILIMDEVISKWGFGSGVSLFIAAGVSLRLFTSLFQFLGTEGISGGFQPVGQLWVLVTNLINGNPTGALAAGVTILATAIIFLIIVWAQALKIEIPLSYDRIRGYGVKWPLAFFYTSVIPVILVSALAANIQLAGGLLENWLGRATILGGFSQGQAISGFASWIGGVNLLNAFITGSYTHFMILQSIGHILFYISFSILFGIFWVKTSGMDAQSQARNIMQSGLTIPGFRKDERILESVLERYILPLTIMGGAAIGFLAAISGIVGTLILGTSFLLVIMIMFQLYQSIAQQHATDMHPALKKFIKV